MQTPKTCIILHLRSVCNHMQYYAIKLTRYYARHTILNFIIKVFKNSKLLFSIFKYLSNTCYIIFGSIF